MRKRLGFCVGIVLSTMDLYALMLLIDERIHVFSYILGMDIRYLLTIGMIGFVAVASIIGDLGSVQFMGGQLPKNALRSNCEDESS